MKSNLIATLSALCLVAPACTNLEITPKDGNSVGDMGKCSPPDLAPAPAKCVAAKGLAGDNLFCVDFKDISSLADLTTWNFKAAGATDCWDLANGVQSGKKVLLIKNFTNYMGDCAFTTPQIDLTASTNTKYSRLTLAIQQRVDVNPATANNGPQFAQIFIDNTSFLLNQSTNKQNPQQLVVSLDKGNLPTMPAGGYLFYVNFHAPYPGGGGNLGWEIESIAINASP